MSEQYGVFELLERANAIPSREARINYLRHNCGKPVLTVLQYALDPNIKWLIPGDFKEYNYKDNPVPEGLETMLLAEARRLYLFTEYIGIPSTRVEMSPEKRKVLFTQLLDMIHPEDIKLLSYCVNKTLPYKNLSYDVVKAAFPNILPGLDTLGESPLHAKAIADYNIFEANGDPADPEPTETVVLEAAPVAPVKRGRGRPKKAK